MAALKQANDFGEQDPRLATTLNNLALLYDAQGKYEQAALRSSRHPSTSPVRLGQIFQRSLAIWEKALGPEHNHSTKQRTLA